MMDSLFIKLGKLLLPFSPTSLLSSLSYPGKIKELLSFYDKYNVSRFLNAGFFRKDRTAEQIYVYAEIRIIFIGFE